MKKYWKICPLLFVLFLWMGVLQTEAAYEGIDNVTLSPDGNAFTTHASDRNTEWYAKGTEVYTGVKSTLREPEVGEHFYAKVGEDIVPIGKWVVSWEEAKCIHKIYPSGNMIYGVNFGKQRCMEHYYSGWAAYCADCEEQVIFNYVYMSDRTAKNITRLDLSKAYYYKCPHCDNLEQALTYEKHVCKDISANRYFVRYHANFGNGYMEKSVHMVDNITIYEGKEITPQTTLNLNTYTRKGYEFVGWNTEKDGSGQSFGDGANILNLSMEQNANVILYAQWKKSESTLEINPAGGSFAGEAGITRVEGVYGTSYSIEMQQLVNPQGHVVHFDTQGGKPLEDITGTQSFIEWKQGQPFHGEIDGNAYTFLGKDGSVDRITAVYLAEPIILPVAEREGYSFGGWYKDKECTEPVGEEGDLFIPQEEVTLYAAWVELLLTATDNYTANQGKGAVDLSWHQKDEVAKLYQVYQRTDATDWIQIDSAEESPNGFQVEKTVSFSGESGSYTVPYSGFYSLTLAGAQGGNYGDFEGGKGGLVQATIYLEKGEKVEYVIGGHNGYSSGGIGKTYANGGGYSKVSTQRQGILLIAGGGGGASCVEDGKAGGSSTQVVTTERGQSGEAGGGGGYQGGASGKVELHQHGIDCKHTHIGEPTVYGGCYTEVAKCGSTEFTKKENYRVFYYGNIADDGSHKFCERCASDNCPGHLDIFYHYTCKSCNTTGTTAVRECTAITAYQPACGKSEGYVCGMTDGQVLSSESAYGGSSYVNTEQCLCYEQEVGVQIGNGELRIESMRLGLVETNLLPGVTATDLAAPDAIEEAAIVKTAVAEDKIRIAFGRPADNGTAYYHMVESYSKNTNQLMCISNQTKNTLVSGIAGYRYVINTESSTIVDDSGTFYAEKGEHPFVVAELGETDKYLHLAAVDKAGNIGPTCHTLLSTRDVIYWPLITEKLQLEQGSNVYPANEADTYYVKADDSTPLTITLEGLLCGTARKEYQINRAEYMVQNMTDVSQAGVLSIYVPNRESVASGTFTYTMQQLQKKPEGKPGLQDASYTVVKRYNQCKSLLAVQKFTLSKVQDGQHFRVMPRVAAVGEQETIYSKGESDLLNSIYLIADGEGPNIDGIEQLQDLDMSEYSEGESVEVDIRAADAGCGLAKFYVEVRNQENGIVMRYTDHGLSGNIHLVITDEEEVFQGEFTIAVYAADHVGNETSMQNELSGIGLTAYVVRVLAPHTPIFKKGESGVLYIEAVGYVEKVEVIFPESFAKEDQTLNRTFMYAVPEYIETEEIPFVVPFTVPEGEMTIQVKAYKAGSELTAEPELVTIKVKGSILDELRTRLR